MITASNAIRRPIRVEGYLASEKSRKDAVPDADLYSVQSPARGDSVAERNVSNSWQPRNYYV